MLDMRFRLDGMMFDVSAGLVEPICWLRVPAKQEYAVCPEKALFRNAEVVEAPGYFPEGARRSLAVYGGGSRHYEHAPREAGR